MACRSFEQRSNGRQADNTDQGMTGSPIVVASKVPTSKRPYDAVGPRLLRPVPHSITVTSHRATSASAQQGLRIGLVGLYDHHRHRARFDEAEAHAAEQALRDPSLAMGGSNDDRRALLVDE